jgi:hypothetical protein
MDDDDGDDDDDGGDDDGGDDDGGDMMASLWRDSKPASATGA